MAFGNQKSMHDRWGLFCSEHRALVESLGSIEIAFSSDVRFEELLQFGATSSRDRTARLSDLSNDEWHAFVCFVDHFKNDWQSYFVKTLCPEYFREVARREKPHSKPDGDCHGD